MLSYIMIVLNLIILPIFAGCGLCSLLRVKKNITGSFLMGYIFTWTVIQLISVPVTMMKGSFRFIAWCTVAILVIVGVVGLIVSIVRKETPLFDKKRISEALRELKYSKFTLIFAIVFVVLTGIILYNMIRLYHIDQDDTRFVVNAVDILRTDSILRTDPTTGTALKLVYGDFYKDLVSCWSVFLAYAGFVGGVSPTIAAHSILQVLLYFLILALYWRISEVLFDSNKEDGLEISEKQEVTEKIVDSGKSGRANLESRLIFMYFVELVTAFGSYSVQSSEVFVLSRLWQGKAVVAGLGIPLIIYLFLKIGNEPQRWSNYIILAMTAIAMCHMSAMGIVIAAVMIAVFALYTAIITKKLRVLIISAICCVPPAIYFLISCMTDYSRYLQG